MGSNNLFLKYNMTPSINIMVNIFEKAHFKALRQLFWKKLSIWFIYSQNIKMEIFEPLNRKIHLSGFTLYERPWLAIVATPLFKIKK